MCISTMDVQDASAKFKTPLGDFGKHKLRFACAQQHCIGPDTFVPILLLHLCDLTKSQLPDS